MLSKQQASDLVLESLVALNLEKDEGEKIPVSIDTVLLGTGTSLDSLDLIFVITNIEDRLYDLADREVQLAAEATVFEGDHAFRTVATLGEHIVAIMQSS